MIRSKALRAGVVALGCAALAQGAASAADPLRLTKPVNATQQVLDPGRLYSSPSFAFDPSNTNIVAAGFADMRSRRCSVVRSLDGGATWALAGGSPALTDYPFCSHGQGGSVQTRLAFGRDGTLYMAMNAWDNQDGARGGGAIQVARTNDLGETWETTLAYTARGKVDTEVKNPRPFHDFAVDRSGSTDVLYVTTSLVHAGFTAPNALPPSPSVIISRDGGRTFDAPVDLAAGLFADDALRGRAFAAITTTTPTTSATPTTAATGGGATTTVPPAGSRAATPNQEDNFGAAGGRTGVEVEVDGDGAAYVFWRTGTANVNPSPPAAHVVSRSTDGGRTWSAVMGDFVYQNQASRYAVSREGVIHRVYQQNPQSTVNSLGDVYYTNSSDGGQSWSEPKILTDDNPADYRGQYFPYIDVAPNGRVDAVWWDTRSDPGIRSNDVYYTYSTDNGATWSANMRITDQSVDRRFGTWGVNYDINMPPLVGSSDKVALFGWDDTRFSRGEAGQVLADDPIAEESFGSGVQDVFISAVQFTALGGGGASSTAKGVMAGVIGLLAVGLVLLVVVGVGRRSSGGGPAAKVGGGKESAKVH